MIKPINIMQKMTRDIDVKKAETKDLLAWYNENSGSAPIKKFADRATAEKRVQELKDAINGLTSGSSKPQAKAEKAAAKAAHKAKFSGKTPKNEGDEKGKQGRTSPFAGKKIKRLVKDNPRREGTHGHKSFSVIKDGMTYEEYIAAGGRSNDLAWDADHGYVEVK